MSERQGPIFIEEPCGCRVDHGIPYRCPTHALSVSRAPQEQDCAKCGRPRSEKWHHRLHGSFDHEFEASRAPAEPLDGGIRFALDWVSEVETPPRPRPSAWKDIDWCEYWRERRHKVLQILQRCAQREAEVERLTAEHDNHGQCHDLVCNGDRTKPRGAKGVGCSCRGREERAAAEQERLRSMIATALSLEHVAYIKETLREALAPLSTTPQEQK